MSVYVEVFLADNHKFKLPKNRNLAKKFFLFTTFWEPFPQQTNGSLTERYENESNRCDAQHFNKIMKILTKNYFVFNIS